ncbi:MAG: exopolysaccharide biosynthesis polyprenyl glycosylphosphotransferase [Paludibacteraceae bacterium]|nr:exopolysaccharide biosynthesis polyprenyl glycosylphosphotransferase [Paludibacteraceae bacterium]
MTNYRQQQLKYIVADFLSALVVWLCFLSFRWLVYEGATFGVDTILIPAFTFWMPLCVYPVGCLIIYYLSGYYLRPFHKHFGRELVTTFGSSVLIALVAFFCIIIDDEVEQYERYMWSLLVLFLLQFVICYIPRVIITAISRLKHVEEEYHIIEQTTDEHLLYQQIAQCYRTGEEIYLVPRVYDIMTGAAHIVNLDDKPYVHITAQHMSDMQLCIKRACDVVVAGTMLVLLLPVYVVLAIIVKASSKGPVLYRQERIGLYGLPFQILKFRTMQVHAEDEVPQLTENDDPRITTCGRWMRRYRLDELPQLWNVLRGEMSLVGPRPERAYFIRQIEQQAPYYCLIYKIRPGLTSWGPIRVGYTDTIEKMVERLNYDIAYMENMSIALDIKILFYTIRVIVDGKGK